MCQPADIHRLPFRHPAEVIGQVVRELPSTLRQAALVRDAYVLYYGGGKSVVVSGDSNCQNLIRTTIVVQFRRMPIVQVIRWKQHITCGVYTTVGREGCLKGL